MNTPTDEWVRLEDVPDHLPRHRAGKKAHRSIGFRWASRGAFGVVLKTIAFGRLRVTRPEWITAFAVAVDAARRAAEAAAGTDSGRPSGGSRHGSIPTASRRDPRRAAVPVRRASLQRESAP